MSEHLNLARYCLDQNLEGGLGEKVALYTDEGTLTYRELQQRSCQAAHWLAQQGLQPEQRLLLALPDNWEYVAAFFGALRLGASVVMANPDLPPSELEDLSRYLRTRVQLTPDRRAEFRQEVPLCAPDFECYPTHPEDIAVVLFSGGTTGRPKAVLQSHGSFVNTTRRYAQDFLGYSPADITLSVPKLFFGYATGSNLIFPLSVGASAVLFEARCTAETLFEKIAEYRPSLLINVPTMVNHLVSHPSATAQDLSCLRFSTSAGEALPEALYHRWKETFGCELLDGLGTAEMWHIFLSNHPQRVRPGTLGEVVPGFEIRLCDESGQPVKSGEVGRMWVAGESRALSYWQRSQLSQQAFCGRFFVSGDLLCQDTEGFYHYCGRADEMLKVSGRWLAPQEVESCLLTHPAVRECAVVGVEGEDGLMRPQAFVISDRAASSQLEEELKAHVLARLEPYKHPRKVVFVEEFPRTHLGKVNRALLRSSH